MNDETKRRLAAITLRWNSIEGRMKDVEFFRGEVIVAAVNELRYAGRKIADALQVASSDFFAKDEQDTKLNEHLLAAEIYLTNADHDLTDAVVLFVTIRLKRAIAAHGLNRIRELIPDFDRRLVLAEEARSIVVESRLNRDRRVSIYDRLASDFAPELIALDKLISVQPNLYVSNGQVERGVRLVSVVSFIAAVLTVANVVFNFVVWSRSTPPPTASQIEAIVKGAK